MINSSKIILKNGHELHLINFDGYDSSYKKLLDEYLAFICEGTNDKTKLKRVKEIVSRYLKGKIGDPTKIAGWLAELFCHIYLNQKNYKPAFLFLNLEEQNSMKKGFDGFYIKKNKYYIYESKSTLPTENDKFHYDGLKVACNDIKSKIGGKKLNKQGDPIDPWSNAIHHFKNSSISGSKPILKQLDELKDRFFEDDFLNIEDCNIIPSSTIYLEDKYVEINKKELKEIINKNISYFKAKEIVLLCINKKSFNYIQDYLNE